MTDLALGVAAGPDPGLLAELPAQASQLGYQAAFCNDSPAGDGLAQLEVWARNSTGIDLGVGVLALDRNPPAGIAARVAQLGLPIERMLLGIGAGFAEHPLGAVRSGVDELRRLLPGARLLVAAMGPGMCRLAGEIGDGVLLNWMTPERAAWARGLVEEGAALAGRPTPRIHGYVRTAIGPGAAERLEREAAFYVQLPHYARHFSAQGTEPAEVGVAAVDPAQARTGLQRYEALDVIVVRVLAERTLDSIITTARAARGDAPL